ncbi:uncharacterized protein LOC142589898 isoform X1 [Dermacentor variabilis]|uniref:uncharacterized protein LOC142589898 isoform X1 n=1 Tax=Dermacentor variabilis TaxID=34621 RepID=UPI003F5C2C92
MWLGSALRPFRRTCCFAAFRFGCTPSVQRGRLHGGERTLSDARKTDVRDGAETAIRCKPQERSRIQADEPSADWERAVRAHGAGARGQHHHARAEHPAKLLCSKVPAPARPHPGTPDGRRGVRNRPGLAVRHLVAISFHTLPRKAQNSQNDLTPVRPCCHLHLHRVGLHALAAATGVQLVGPEAAVRCLVPLRSRHHLPEHISREVQNSRGAHLHRLSLVSRFRHIFDAASDGPQGAAVRRPALLRGSGVLQVGRPRTVRARHLAPVRQRGHAGALPRRLPVPLPGRPGRPGHAGRPGRRCARAPRLAVVAGDAVATVTTDEPSCEQARRSADHSSGTGLVTPTAAAVPSTGSRPRSGPISSTPGRVPDPRLHKELSSLLYGSWTGLCRRL